MRRLRGIAGAVLALGLLLPISAGAFWQSRDSGYNKTATQAYAGPGDVVSGAFAWYGLRAYSAAVAATGTQKSVRLRRTSDSTETDILILATGVIDTATASTFCNATTCFVTTFYDQSGNARNATQTTAANQPAFIFSCLGAHPCLRATSNVQTISAGSQTVGTPHSYSYVANRSVGTTLVYWLITNGNNVAGAASASANQWVLSGGTSGSITAAATDATWHAGAAVGNGASSVLAIDGSDTTGTVTINASAGTLFAFAGGASATANLIETGAWGGVAFSAGNRTTLNSQQHAYWGF